MRLDIGNPASRVVAIYRLQMTSLGRSDGRRATSAAAYRAGQRIRDERAGRVFDHSRRDDVLHAQIVLPSRFPGIAATNAAGAGPAATITTGAAASLSGSPNNQAVDADAKSMDWARDRATLWNAAERAETRRNSRVAREYQVALPADLSPAQRLELAQRFSVEIANRYNVAVDLAVHQPRAGGDPRNYHAHLLTTTREITPTGLGAKTGFDMNEGERKRRGLAGSRQELVAVRERWATLTNEALREAGIAAGVDHRSLAARGIDREPLHLPFVSIQMERRGLRSEIAERIRERYQQRVAQRLERAAQRLPAEPPEASSEVRPRSLEKIRRQARLNWLQLRSAPATKSTAADSGEARDRDAHHAKQQGRNRNGPEDDFAM